MYTQLAECLLTLTGLGVCSPIQADVVAYACNHSTWKVGEEDLECNITNSDYIVSLRSGQAT